jgi:hypothetical protein
MPTPSLSSTHLMTSQLFEPPTPRPQAEAPPIPAALPLLTGAVWLHCRLLHPPMNQGPGTSLACPTHGNAETARTPANTNVSVCTASWRLLRKVMPPRLRKC